VSYLSICQYNRRRRLETYAMQRNLKLSDMSYFLCVLALLERADVLRYVVLIDRERVD